MRGTMHPQKSDGQRRRTNAPTHGETLLPRDDELRGPELSDGYSDQTRAWFEVWRRSPQAAVFEATDWSRLLLLAVIVEGYFTRPSAAALSEIRMNEERLGATVVDRMRARMRIEPREEKTSESAADGEGADVIQLDDARAALRRRML